MCSILFIYFLKHPLLGKDSGVAKPGRTKRSPSDFFFAHYSVLLITYSLLCNLKKNAFV